MGEESPGFKRTWCQLTAGWGNPRESATESKPLTYMDSKGERAR